MQKDLKVLLIEDNPRDIDLIREMLIEAQENSFELERAARLKQGLEQLGNGRFDLVLLDLTLPDSQGFETFTATKEHAPHLPIIVLTDLNDEALAMKAVREGAQDYLLKGKMRGDLLARSMRYAVERKLAEDELRRHRDNLEELVAERTAELRAVNERLQRQVDRRERAEEALREQLERVSLLNQLARAIAERQDLESIFRAVFRRLHAQMGITVGAAYLFNPELETLTLIVQDGIEPEKAASLNLVEGTAVSINQMGPATSIQGEGNYLPNLAKVEAPIPQTWAEAGIRSVVTLPIQDGDKTLGAFVVGREGTNGFISRECEFLRGIAEHVSLSARQTQLYENLHTAYDELRKTQRAVMEHERLQALGEMASGIAHDINNALGGALLYLSMPLDDPAVSPKTKKRLETIRTAVEDVAGTVRRMRQFYQKHPEGEMKPLDLNQLVEGAIELTRPRWADMPEQRGVVIDVQKDLVDDLPPVMGLEEEVRGAITNLIINGVDAMPEGGTLTIRTRATGKGKRKPAQVLLEVIDTGIGMDEETQERCFEPFFTTKGKRGTGMGLAVVYGTMERHGGHIEVESKLNKGTTLSLVFPTQEAEDEDTQQLKKPSEHLRILCIDDEPLMRSSLKAALEKENHTVEVADSGRTGLVAFQEARRQEEPFDIVITDLGMPHVGGMEVARTVKKKESTTPVILLTGWGMEVEADQGKLTNVDYLLTKPPKMDELTEALAKVTEAG